MNTVPKICQLLSTVMLKVRILVLGFFCLCFMYLLLNSLFFVALYEYLKGCKLEKVHVLFKTAKGSGQLKNFNYVSGLQHKKLALYVSQYLKLIESKYRQIKLSLQNNKFSQHIKSDIQRTAYKIYRTGLTQQERGRSQFTDITTMEQTKGFKQVKQLTWSSHMSCRYGWFSLSVTLCPEDCLCRSRQVNVPENESIPSISLIVFTQCRQAEKRATIAKKTLVVTRNYTTSCFQIACHISACILVSCFIVVCCSFMFRV